MPAMARLDDKVAVVTGAAHGLGRAIAERLAGEGATVVLGDVDAPALDRTGARIVGKGGRASGVVGDVTEEEPAARLIAAAVERGGRLDILVNNVGGSRNARIWEMAVADWDFTLRLNLRSTFLCTRAAVPHMMKRRYGRIVCISSGAREGTPWTAYYQGGSAYSAAKAGVHGFIRDVALELAEHGINVNAVAPGPIDTERVGEALRRMNETVEYSPNRMTPLRRLGQQVCREGVPQAVRMHGSVARNQAGVQLHNAACAPVGKPRTQVIRKESFFPRLNGTHCEILLQRSRRGRSIRNLPFLATLATHQQPTVGEVYVGQFQPNEFAHAQPAAIEQFEGPLVRASQFLLQPPASCIAGIADHSTQIRFGLLRTLAPGWCW